MVFATLAGDEPPAGESHRVDSLKEVVPAGMHSFGEVILHMCNLDQPFVGVKEPDTQGFMMFYEAYNQFGFAFPGFSFGRYDQVVVVVLLIFTNTSNDSGCH